jgi:hypothetical protein
MKRRLLIALSLGAVLAGCGSMQQGSIYSDDGKVIPFQIERAYHSGNVTANDPATGEHFTGTYVGVLERTTATTPSVGNGQSNVSGPAGSAMVANTGSDFTVAPVGSEISYATALFTGDKGTVLTCELKIQAGIEPHGFGDCEGNKGKKYKLQF